MYVAQVTAWGEAPKYTEVADLPQPHDNETRIKVEAVGVHRVVRARAAGQHYSAKELPHVPGIDGIGTAEDGTKVYFTTFGPNLGGSLSEYINVPKNSVFALPAGIDGTQAAALVNPAISSWLAMAVRAKPLPKDFSVLIIGATSASGRIAVGVARALGAKRVIGAARNSAALLALDLDDKFVIAEDAATTDFTSLGDVDVVLDYVYGPVTARLFDQLASKRPTTYVQIGTLSGGEISLKGDLLRSKQLTLRGSGPGAWSMQDSVEAIPDLLKILPSIKHEPVKVVSLKDVESVWNTSGTERLVIVP